MTRGGNAMLATSGRNLRDEGGTVTPSWVSHSVPKPANRSQRSQPPVTNRAIDATQHPPPMRTTPDTRIECTTGSTLGSAPTVGVIHDHGSVSTADNTTGRPFAGVSFAGGNKNVSGTDRRHYTKPWGNKNGPDTDRDRYTSPIRCVPRMPLDGVARDPLDPDAPMSQDELHEARFRAYVARSVTRSELRANSDA